MDTFFGYPKSMPDRIQVAGISACRRCFSVIHQKNVMTFLGILRYVWCWGCGKMFFFQQIRNLELDVAIVAYRKWFAEHFECMRYYRHIYIDIWYTYHIDMCAVSEDIFRYLQFKVSKLLSTTFTRCIGMCFLVRRMSFPLVRKCSIESLANYLLARNEVVRKIDKLTFENRFWTIFFPFAI